MPAKTIAMCSLSFPMLLSLSLLLAGCQPMGAERASEADEQAAYRTIVGMREQEVRLPARLSGQRLIADTAPAEALNPETLAQIYGPDCELRQVGAAKVALPRGLGK